jgi:hypothetical protein
MIIATDMYRKGLDSANHATHHHANKPKDRGQHAQHSIPHRLRHNAAACPMHIKLSKL